MTDDVYCAVIWSAVIVMEVLTVLSGHANVSAMHSIRKVIEVTL